MSKQELYDRLASMLTGTFGVPAEDVAEDATWEAMGLDSLDLVELMLVVEQELGVRIEDDQLEELVTVRDAVDAIAQEGVAA